MSCPSNLTHSMYADGELSARESTLLELHAATCAACGARIEALRRERAVLRLALREVEDEAPIPRFVPPPRPRDFVVLVLAVVLIGGFSSAFWNTVSAAVPDALRWLNPFESGELFERAVSVVTFIVYEGSAMWTAALNFIGAALIVAFVAWLSSGAVRRRGFAAVAVSLLAVVIALPSTGHALEVRHEKNLITVPAGETIDDSVIAAATKITIDGNINGDLLAFGQEVTVRGNVTGNLVTGAQRVTIEGTIGGTVIGGGENVSFARARVGRDLYGFGSDVDIASDAEVSGNATAFGKTVAVNGRVGRDLHSFGEAVRISGNVGDDVVAGGAHIALLPTARVTGDVSARVDSADDLEIDSAAVVGGNVDKQVVEREQRRNHYATFGYYFSQVVRLGAMFLAGLALLWVFPVLRSVLLRDSVAVVRSFGIGLAAAVTLPVAAIMLCLTVVGIPIGILTMFLGAVALYFSKIVVAQIIGSAVLSAPQEPRHVAATLVTGLVIVIVAINLPWIGGIANLIMTLVGLGLIVTLLFERFNRAPA
ncbi:MAG TPA: zf-HC2 domain-containing protein [Gammaproteobacteria bacterium]|nr:zf-HC2 domain-containing protein [Gammaproteobacteria bacterium]